MDPITWSMVAGLLIKYGPEVANLIISKWNAGKSVTIEEWNELLALASKTAESQLLDAIGRNGFSLDNEHVKNLLSMLPKKVN